MTKNFPFIPGQDIVLGVIHTVGYGLYGRHTLCGHPIEEYLDVARPITDLTQKELSDLLDDADGGRCATCRERLSPRGEVA
jgi:hypothetical protein